jgi:hypothetical protein
LKQHANCVVLTLYCVDFSFYASFFTVYASITNYHLNSHNDFQLTKINFSPRHCFMFVVNSPSTIVLKNKTKKKQPLRATLSSHLPGDVLLSQGEIPQLPSALKSLTSVFGMGTGVTSSPLSPDEYSIEGLFLQN